MTAILPYITLVLFAVLAGSAYVKVTNIITDIRMENNELNDRLNYYIEYYDTVNNVITNDLADAFDKIKFLEGSADSNIFELKNLDSRLKKLEYYKATDYMNGIMEQDERSIFEKSLKKIDLSDPTEDLFIDLWNPKHLSYTSDDGSVHYSELQIANMFQSSYVNEDSGFIEVEDDKYMDQDGVIEHYAGPDFDNYSEKDDDEENTSAVLSYFADKRANENKIPDEIKEAIDEIRY